MGAMAEKPLQLGVQLYPYSVFGEGLDELVDFVQKAERWGYDFIQLPEHQLFPVEEERTMGRPWWDPAVLVALLAQRTTTIRFAFSILILPQYNPMMLAKSLATLDHVSDGRIDVGVAVGWLRAECEALGVDFDTRGARADESIEVLRNLWTTHPCTHQGEFFSYAGMSCHPKPVQRPHPPIWVGGTLKASLRRAVRLGDGWNPQPAPLPKVEEGIRNLHSALEERNRQPEGFPISYKMPFIERSVEVTEHAVAANGSSELRWLEGDLGRADEFMEWAAGVGITHVDIELPADPARQLEEAERFAAHSVPAMGDVTTKPRACRVR